MRYEKRGFEGDTLTLDNNEFIDCVFKGCTLEYSGGNFEITPLKGVSGFTVKFLGAAENGKDLYATLQGVAATAAPIGSRLQIGGAIFEKVGNVGD